MTDFKPGDRVRTIAKNAAVAPIGTTGVVTSDTPGSVYPYYVRYDKAQGTYTGDFYRADELKLIEPAPRAYTPTNLRAKAALLRNERDDILDRTDGLLDQVKTIADQSLALERAADYLEQNS